MDKVLMAFAVAAGMSAIVLVATMFGALFGGIAGWVCFWVFDDSLPHLVTWLGYPETTGFEFGAAFGFLGGFFKASQTNNNS